MKFDNLGLVFILYYPDSNLVLKNVERLRKQAGVVYLIDNTPDLANEILSDYSTVTEGVYYIALKTNAGIAAAQNIGIEKVLEHAAMEYVMFLDQDSEPDDDMILHLMKAHELLAARNISVSAVGPLAINKDTNKAYKDRELSKDYIEGVIVQKTDIMSSGSVVSKKAILAIGLMETALFIDGVDSEWCWRGNAKGYRCFVNEQALLQHKLGEGDTKFLWFRFATPPPIRCFYQYRNFLILIRRSYTPLNWKVLNLIKYIVKMGYYPLILKNRKAYMKNIFKGIKAGFNYKNI
jgi:rhamnosyltransferase